MEFLRWLLIKFSTRAHFMRFIATVIVLVGVIQLLKDGDIHNTWTALLGMVLGYYFRPNGGRSHD